VYPFPSFFFFCQLFDSSLIVFTSTDQPKGNKCDGQSGPAPHPLSNNRQLRFHTTSILFDQFNSKPQEGIRLGMKKVLNKVMDIMDFPHCFTSERLQFPSITAMIMRVKYRKAWPALVDTLHGPSQQCNRKNCENYLSTFLSLSTPLLTYILECCYFAQSLL